MTPDQEKQLTNLEALAVEKKIAGVFKRDGTGMPIDEVVLFAWKAGYIAVPTVQALLDELANQLSNDSIDHN